MSGDAREASGLRRQTRADPGTRSNRKTSEIVPEGRRERYIDPRGRDARSGLTKNTRLMAASVYLEKL